MGPHVAVLHAGVDVLFRSGLSCARLCLPPSLGGTSRRAIGHRLASPARVHS